ncbi:hypothetical protein Nos7524_1830 [Nostoc sp. PCC 7524]|uniref:2OG-Fe(II)-dependent halogenase WelO5 family protein n=1 Tax=Nostoc sp. (strain ATCC 29411 / PCC 7524) TaxID=28072 RepID=UPI00029F3EC6|nr:hypothetical protein [Nostoc sp. PCC 7524]AFY47693.1 hypothetical protein Nos7524_1830 [Nostoc sp. PCC 7524]
MVKLHTPEKSLFQFLDIPAANVQKYSSAIEDIYEKRIDGMIIRNVFSPETLYLNMLQNFCELVDI